MEKAKQAVTNFVSSDGKHKTVVDEDVRPSVTEEHIRPHRHENVMTALDKEIHQHHHHTVVQPVKYTETLPEKHTHMSVPVEHKVFHHGNKQELRDILDRDIAKYRSSSMTHETTHSSTKAPVVTGERVHHHVHEHVQPVVQKETVAPEVVHTTIPIHETHHAEAVHHGTSTLPLKTMDEWKNEGGVLGGRAVHTLSDTAGCPAPYNRELQAEQMGADRDMHPSLLGHKHAHPHTHTHGAGHGVNGLESTGTGTGVGTGIGTGIGTGMDGTQTMGSDTARIPSDTRRGENITTSTSRDSDLSAGRAGKTSPTSDKAPHYALGSGGAAGTTGAGSGTAASAPRTETGQTSDRQKPYVDSLGVRSGSQAHAKRHASLADKLNPFKDADGDGKKGIMD